MGTLFAPFVHDDRGQDLIEYAFLALFIALVVIVSLQALADGINLQMSNLGTAVSGGS